MHGATLLLLGAVLGQPVPPADDRAALESRAGALSQKALELVQQDRAAQAVPLAEEALALYRRLYPKDRYPAGHADLAASLHALGFVLRARGDITRAETLYREALAMGRKLFPPERFPDGSPELVVVLNNLGRLLEGRGDLDGAQPLLREAVAMCRKLYPRERDPDGHAHLARSLTNLGLLLKARGELAAAEPVLSEGLAMCRQLWPPERFPDGHPAVAASISSLGLLLEARGEQARAEPLLREAVAMYRRLAPPEHFPVGAHNLAVSLTNLGTLLEVHGKPAEGEPLLREALALLRKLYPPERYPNGYPELAHSLDNLSGAVMRRGDLDGAERLRREALAMCRKLHPPARYPDGHPDVAVSLDNLAHLLGAVRNDLDRAEPLLREALAMNRKLYPPERYPAGHPQLARCVENLGMLLQARGAAAEAVTPMAEALAMQQRLTEAFLAGVSEAEALNRLAALQPRRSSYLSVTRDGTGARGANATPLAVYAAVWQSKGLVARWLGQRRLALLAAADAETRALARDLAATRQALARLLLAPTAGPGSAGRLQQLAERKEDLEKALARRLPAFAAVQAQARRTPDDLRELLPADGVFIDLVRYIRHEHPADTPGLERPRRRAFYVAFVLRRDRPVRRVELGPAAPIDAALHAWRDALGGRPAKADSPERTLRRLVWEPLARHLPAAAGTVWLAPDDRLTGLPWAALPGERPGTVLLEEVALAVVPHGPFLLEALEGASRTRPPPEAGRLLALGGVDYGQAPNQKPLWRPLPGTERERQAVLALARTVGIKDRVERSGPEAGTDRVLADLAGARWAHLATHGSFADPRLRSVLNLDEKDYELGWAAEKVGVGARNPLALSGLVLVGANLTGEQAPAAGGVLTAEAIAALDLDGLDLAVLSACDTGLGEVAGGEGVFGLQRAFHLAGARNVVASLWQVDDEATAALMALFYHHLWKEGQAPAQALRQAQLALYRHPERIPQLARARGPDFEKVARLPAASGAALARRSTARLWAGFVLSGAGQ
jgi:CHAT domain-containing protein/tetratricopeptide (TPR) repeat protein